MNQKSIMFVCKRNSCRSQMAEGFAKTLGQGKVSVTSSGLEASRVHPTAIAKLQFSFLLETTALEDQFRHQVS